jgi:hypothetical protein
MTLIWTALMVLCLLHVPGIEMNNSQAPKAGACHKMMVLLSQCRLKSAGEWSLQERG